MKGPHVLARGTHVELFGTSMQLDVLIRAQRSAERAFTLAFDTHVGENQ